MTENYFVFIEQPCIMQLKKLPYILYMGQHFSKVFKVLPKERSRFHIVDKRTGETTKAKYFGDFLFCFHQINAYEKDGHIVLDIVAATNGNDVS